MQRNVLIFVALLCAAVMLAQIPRTMSFMGRLTDDSGSPLTEPTSVVINLYATPTGGSPVYSETQTIDPDAAGNVHILIGNETELDIPFDRPYYLEVIIGGEALPTRMPLVSSPYSLSSVNSINGLSASDGNIVFQNSETVTWETDPVEGTITANASGSAGHRAVFGNSETNGAIQVNSTTGTPVVHIESAPGPSQGMNIVANNADSTVLSVVNQSTSSENSVVSIVSNSTHVEAAGLEVYSAGGYGIICEQVVSEDGVIGIYQGTDAGSHQAYGVGVEMSSTADSSMALAGYSTGESGAQMGVYGFVQSSTPGAVGVLGVNPNETAQSPIGVMGVVKSGSMEDMDIGGKGVYGKITAGTGAGVYGENTSDEAGYGVWGMSKTDAGVVGLSTSSEEFAVGVIGSVEPESGEFGTMAIGVMGEMYANTDSSTGVYGITAEGEGVTFGVVGKTQSASAGASGVLGMNVNEESTSPTGVMGVVNSGTIEDMDIGGKGVYGKITAGYGAGVYGESTSEDISYGVVGISKMDAGVLGISTSSEVAAVGVAGTVEPESGEFGTMAIGVLGEMYADTDSSTGVYGATVDSDGLTFGVIGRTGGGADGAAGVLGISNNPGSVAPTGVLGKATATEDGEATGVKGSVTIPDGRIGFGVYGEAEASGEGEGAGVYGYANKGYGVAGEIETEEDDYAAVYGGTAGGRTYGIFGETYSTSDSTAGVYGIAGGEVNVNFGVIGESASSSPFSAGVLGRSDNSVGVMGTSSGSDVYAIGVYGYIKDGSGIPIYGENESNEDESIAMAGAHLSETGSKYGVAGEIHSPDGAGIYGVSVHETGHAPGVLGESISSGGFGVVGIGATGVSAEGVNTGLLASTESDTGIAIDARNKVVVGNGTVRTAEINPSNASFKLNNSSGSELTTFGGPTGRVAIQSVNGSAKPTIPDNNFLIVGEYPISVTNGAHGVTISCEDCGGGGSSFDCIVCDGSSLTVPGDVTTGGALEVTSTISAGACITTSGSLTAGTSGSAGGVVVNDSGGRWNHLLDSYGVSSTLGGSLGGDLHVTGDIFGASKHFVAPHPEQPGMEIVFTSTESDQANIEHNGMVNLVDGFAEYNLPHEFVLMAEEGTMAVIATAQSVDVPANIGAVVTQDGTVHIRNFEGTDLPVAFSVTAIRKGYMDYPIVREHTDNPFGRPEEKK